MPYYTKLGLLPKKRHVQFRRPDGVLYSEELFGTEGFTGPSSTMYHIHPPTQVYGWKPVASTKVQYVEPEIMRMRHVMTGGAKMAPKGDFITGRVVLFGNADCEMAVCNPAEQLGYHFKNAQGDENGPHGRCDVRSTALSRMHSDDIDHHPRDVVGAGMFEVSGRNACVRTPTVGREFDDPVELVAGVLQRRHSGRERRREFSAQLGVRRRAPAALCVTQHAERVGESAEDAP
jgi:hypothetical protein